jgi:uncharacterized Fe-S cluster protein YjdI/CDGSH-type Zn-finger protein
MSERGRKYIAEGIVVFYQPRLCIHAAECVRGLGQVFDTQKKPWIQPEHAGVEELVEVIQRCPSGALQFERLDGGEAEAVPQFVSADLMPNGPLYVRGPMVFKNEQGEVVLESTRAALCRCGASKNKPFCDNSHLEVGFQASYGQINLEIPLEKP